MVERKQLLSSFRDDRLEPEVKIIEAIKEYGPRNISLISRVTNIPAETVRYKVKRQFTKLGLKISAELNYSKIGLRPYLCRLEFAPSRNRLSRSVIEYLSSRCYLAYYSKIIPDGTFISLFTLPQEKVEDQLEVLRYLIKIDAITNYSIDEVIAYEYYSINPRHFDFSKGAWEIDWGRIDSESPKDNQRIHEQSRVDLDKYDLMIIRELQRNSLQHVSSIAKRLDVHPKTLSYHYDAHVRGKGLIDGYSVKWDPAPNSALSAMITFHDLSREELHIVRAFIKRLPFLCNTYELSNLKYIASLMIPINESVTTLEFINKKLNFLGRRISLSLLARNETNYYPVPYHLFADSWELDRNLIVKEISKVLGKV